MREKRRLFDKRGVLEAMLDFVEELERDELGADELDDLVLEFIAEWLERRRSRRVRSRRPS